MPRLIRFSAITLGALLLSTLTDSRYTPAIQRTALAAEPVTLDRNAREYWASDQIPWKKSNTGAQSAILLGDPAKPGLYIQLLKRVPNNWSNPHYHNHDRMITVLDGTFLIGTGSTFDKEKTVALTRGAVVKDIANQMHYDGAGPDGVVLEIVGIVPPGGPGDAPPVTSR